MDISGGEKEGIQMEKLQVAENIKCEIVEIAYRIPGKEWKRKVFKSETAALKWLDKKMENDSDIEVRWAR